MIPEGARIFPLKPGTKRPRDIGYQKKAIIAPKVGRPSGNYGILLECRYLVVDIDVDHPEREAFEASLPTTWSQRTSRNDCVGMHYLYRLPDGFKGRNGKYLASDGTRIADLKCNGFIVGPGSIVNGNSYQMINEKEPQWISRTLSTEF